MLAEKCKISQVEIKEGEVYLNGKIINAKPIGDPRLLPISSALNVDSPIDYFRKNIYHFKKIKNFVEDEDLVKHLGISLGELNKYWTEPNRFTSIHFTVYPIQYYNLLEEQPNDEPKT